VSAGRRRPLLTLATLSAVAVVGLLALVVLGGGAAVGAAQGGGGTDARADGPTGSVPFAHVAPGRPCADPLETQGFRPGPGAFEPNHTGIDLVCLHDRTLVDVLPGTVVAVQDAGCPNTVEAGQLSFGCQVIVKTQLGRQELFVRYAHVLEGSVLVSVGQAVTPGTPLATEGSSGFSTGPHVHFEADAGGASTANAVNPTPLLDAAIVR
jgi:murein DD-endopeptidase MepM/ murein hydrolase activator NlpD